MRWKERKVTRDEIRSFEKEFKKKAKFLIDECLGSEAARIIKELGWDAVFTGDIGISGHEDEDVFAYSWKERRFLLTHDADFWNDKRFPFERTYGIVILPVATGNIDILEKEIARVLITVGKYEKAYKGFKIRIREDGCWEVKHREERVIKRLLKFEKYKIFELG